MNAYNQGKEAALKGDKETDNPHDPKGHAYDDWLEGFYHEEVMEKTHKGRHEWQ